METGYYPPFFIPPEMFKSYYVVWKPATAKHISVRPASLNRTMQYGNYISLFEKDENNCRLNRTMQYGNSTITQYFQQ